MELMNITAVLVLVLITVTYSKKPHHFGSKRVKTVYSFYNFEKAFCQHGVNGRGKKDGNYAHPKYCERFITCEHFEHSSRNSKATMQYCPYGLFFNEKIGVCDWPKNVDCFLYQGKTCFGARRNRYGQFRASQSGYIESIKLIHESGYITCKHENPTYKSFWGCNTEKEFFKYLVNTWITTKDNKNGIIFPTKDIYDDVYGNYELKGYNQLSPYIKWDADPYHPTKVQRGDQLRVWYGEDLFNINQYNNRGKHCIEIYALFSFYKPYYFLNH